MDYILSLSYGKDSIACLEAIEKLNMPLTRVVTVDIFATKNISGDLPIIQDFKKKVDSYILEKYNIVVEHITSGKTYEEMFYKKKTEKSNNCGEIRGWLISVNGGPWCQYDLKMEALKKLEKRDNVVYVGIALDEEKRFGVFSKNKISPLVLAKYTEKDCFEICKRLDLLSPVYEFSERQGCWFCHNQSVNQLRVLKNNYPKLWKLMLKWDSDSPVSFGTDGRRLSEYNKRFLLENKGLIPKDSSFRWKMLNKNYMFKKESV